MKESHERSIVDIENLNGYLDCLKREFPLIDTNKIKNLEVGEDYKFSFREKNCTSTVGVVRKDTEKYEVKIFSRDDSQ